MRGVLIPTPSVHCHGIGAFNLPCLSYRHFLFVSSCVISYTYCSTAHFISMSLLSSCFIYITVLMIICFVFTFMLLRIKFSVTTYFPALIFVFIFSYFIFHVSAFSCWLLSFCHFMCVFLKFSGFMFVRLCPFNLYFASDISS